MSRRSFWRALVAETLDHTTIELMPSHQGERLTHRLAGRPEPTATLDAISSLISAKSPLDSAALHDLRIATDVPRSMFKGQERPTTALVTTARLREVLEVPDNAPDPLDPSLYDVLIEVPEHVRADGSVVAVPQLDDFVPLLEAAARSCTASAVCLAHAPAYPVHEQLVLSHVFRSGFTHVAAGYEVAPELPFTERLAATLLDAQAAPVISDYLTAWNEVLGDAANAPRLRFAGGDFGALDGEAFRGRAALGSWKNAVALGRQVLDQEDEIVLALAGARESTPFASRSHAVGAVVGTITAASLSMIVASLRSEAFTELRARRVRDEDMAWNALATVTTGGSSREIDITERFDTLLKRNDARLERIEVAAIEDAGDA